MTSAKKTKQNPVIISRFKEALPIFLISILIFLVVFQYTWYTLELSVFFTYLGIFLGISSFSFLITGYYQMGDSWKVGIKKKSKENLIKKGVFSITRNPIYIFFNIFSITFFLTTGSILYLLISILIITSIHILILEEEKSLEKAHGEKYVKYKENVRRYF